jgi:tetratricopeptide (TPR) repeat protein
MDGVELSKDIPDEGSSLDETVQHAIGYDDLVKKFESLGGSGHGPEFAIFQQRFGGDPDGLLTGADLGTDFLTAALETRFEGVGLEENTIVFAPPHSDEWWTKDERYWMAMRSLVKFDGASVDEVKGEICGRLQSLRHRLITDLEAGEKIFVFKNLHRNLTPAELHRLHAAVRAYGTATLFCVGYGSAAHPAGTVEEVEPGLLLGYIDHFAFSPHNEFIGLVDEYWLLLCERAYRLHRRQTGLDATRHGALIAEPEAAEPVALPEKKTPLELSITTPSIVPRRPNALRSRQIVLIGNCQMQAMAGLYKRFVAGRAGDVVKHVPSYEDLTDDHRDAIQQADVVVEQLFDLKPQAETEGLSTTAPRIFIPMVTAAFLWPFAGSPHPKNTSYPYLTGGPYGGEAADSYLNRLIIAGVDPEEAVETYANLEVNSRVNLNRLFEIVMERQRSRDEAAGYQIADIMEKHFRTEQIFLSPYHPNVRIATALASQFFAQLGAERDEIDRMRDCTRITPFPKSELPFHPSVVRHFGLDFVAPDRGYRYMNEGLFTFREYALRYMRYEWNDALEEGLHLTHIGKVDQAGERLTLAVKHSPLSAAGYSALSHALNHRGLIDEAIAAQRRAVELEPESASYRASLGNLLRQARQLDDALVELRAAVAIDPAEPHYRVLLAHLLREYGKVQEAGDLIREAIEFDPYSAGLRTELASFLEAAGDTAGAVEALEGAVALAPVDEPMQLRIAQLLGRLNRTEEATEAARKAVTLAPDSTRARVVLSDLLLRRGDPSDALKQAYVAVVNEPDSAHAYGHLGHVLALTGDIPAAEAAFRRAAKLDPHNAHFRHEISMVLHRQQRFPQAIAAAREAVELEARNPHRCVHLAGFLAHAGDFAAAVEAQHGAVKLDPEAAAFRLGLSDLFVRNGQLDEALAEAAIAVEYHPHSVQALEHLAHVVRLRGEFDRAEATLQRALEIEPRNDKLLRARASLPTRGGRVGAV